MSVTFGLQAEKKAIYTFSEAQISEDEYEALLGNEPPGVHVTLHQKPQNPDDPYLQEWDFFRIENIRVPPDEVDEVMSSGREVYELPVELSQFHDVQMSNFSFRPLQQLLRLDGNEDYGRIEPGELLKRISVAEVNLGRERREYFVEPTDTGNDWSGQGGARMIGGGVSVEATRQKLDRLEALARFAISQMEVVTASENSEIL